MNIIVINLKRAEERREKMISQLEALSLEATIMEAVDWKDLPPEELVRKLSLEGGWREGEAFQPGEIACIHSHMKALKEAKRMGWPYTIIMEDDIILADDFRKRIRWLLGALPSDWGHVFLSGAPDRIIGMPPINTDFLNIIRTRVFTSGAFCMLVRESSYDMIINYLSLFKTTADDAYNVLIGEGRLKSWTFYPFVAYVKLKYSYIWDKEFNEEHPSFKYFKKKYE